MKNNNTDTDNPRMAMNDILRLPSLNISCANGNMRPRAGRWQGGGQTFPCCSAMWAMYSSRSLYRPWHGTHFQPEGVFILSFFTDSFPPSFQSSPSELSEADRKREEEEDVAGHEGSSCFGAAALWLCRETAGRALALHDGKRSKGDFKPLLHPL